MKPNIPTQCQKELKSDTWVTLFLELLFWFCSLLWLFGFVRDGGCWC